MKIFRYKGLPITFQLCREYEMGSFDVHGFLAMRDDGTPIDRFSVFCHATNRHHVAWTGDTCCKEIKIMRDEWAEEMNHASREEG